MKPSKLVSGDSGGDDSGLVEKEKEDDSRLQFWIPLLAPLPFLEVGIQDEES